jgi:hypothetical protein
MNFSNFLKQVGTPTFHRATFKFFLIRKTVSRNTLQNA